MQHPQDHVPRPHGHGLCCWQVSPGQLAAAGTCRQLLAPCAAPMPLAELASPRLGRRLPLQKMGLHPAQRRSKMAFLEGGRRTTGPGMLHCAPAEAAPVAQHAGGCSASWGRGPEPPYRNTACLGSWSRATGSLSPLRDIPSSVALACPTHPPSQQEGSPQPRARTGALQREPWQPWDTRVQDLVCAEDVGCCCPARSPWTMLLWYQRGQRCPPGK